jgi:prolyl 4-hydroxylase
MPQVQNITREVLRWISAQAQAGHTQEAVLAAMRRSGWHDSAAQQAIFQAKAGGFEDGVFPPQILVPQLDLEDMPAVLSAPDRDVKVLGVMTLPRLVMLGGLLSESECDAVMEMAGPRLERSRIIDGWSGAGEMHEARTSEGMHFEREAEGVIARIEARIAALLHWPVTNGEGMQVLRYQQGAEYQPHHDYFDPESPGHQRQMQRGGQRVATVLMYLNTPARGGETTFPDAGLRVAAVKGNAVFFSYDRPHPITKTLHGGAPVREGEKWIATKWLREGIC